ncbi:hypothetical protein EV385_6618 [Krasilnikovia cinnamomea]|uniref:Uncharacterized protein n=1 Tax=Krasilnikovia cinnamomea TaxID=349313 RepID=A0A4Q7Z916_9ACTN|nr:hypothetical protein [Krasilnikovia cinnamomea]RZU46544.1 hypothetical protein EV385_6618 [Krasilnikovia cinnamomea]
MDPVTIFTILVWLAVAKSAVYILEDAAYGVVRGKQSPRQRERAVHRAAEQAAAAQGKPPPPPTGGAWGRTRAAVGGYLAGVVEDATAAARARKRRAVARRAGARAVDGVFVDHADDEGFYADCDICGWCSRRYRLEANALGAGRDHTRVEHPERYHPDPAPADPAPAEPAEQSQDGAGQTQPEPEVIDMPVVLACGQCPRGVMRDGQCDSCRRVAPASASAGDRPQLRVIPGGSADGAPARNDATTAASLPAREAADDAAPADGTNPPADDRDLMALIDATQTSGAGTPVGTANERSTTVNLDATGPEEIRAGFNQAAETASTRAEQIAEFAGVLAEAAERFENLRMATTTVEHVREASEAFQAAKALIDNAQESLEAALADFNAKDGHVGDTVAETGGNLASEEVLVGG